MSAMESRGPLIRRQMASERRGLARTDTHTTPTTHLPMDSDLTMMKRRKKRS